MAIFQASRPKCLGDHRVEAKKEIAAENGHAVKQDRADTDRTYRNRAVWQMAHSDGVHEIHAEPAQLSERQRRSQAQHGPELLAHFGKSKHSLKVYHRLCAPCLAVPAAMGVFHGFEFCGVL